MFTDIKSTDWYYGPVTKAARMGGVKGFPDGTYRPTENGNRAQDAVLYLRAVKAFRYALRKVRKCVVIVKDAQGGEGTGVIVDPRGLVWTNRHVVCHNEKKQDGSTITDVVSDMYQLATCEKDYYDNPNGQWLIGRDEQGTLLPGALAQLHRDETGRKAVSIDWSKGGTGPANCGCLPDFALIQMTPEQLAEAKRRLGDPLPCAKFVAGSPDLAEPLFHFGDPSLERGWFSNLYAARRSKLGGLTPVLGLDGGVNPGNSGGPVWDLEGHCVGITTWKIISLSGTPIDNMGLAQVSWELGLKWLAYHKVFVDIEEDIPDEDE
jgi:hypothetical protein